MAWQERFDCPSETAMNAPHPVPFNETARLEALHALPDANYATDPAFQKIADTARKILGAPVAHVNLIDETYHYSKGGAGMEMIVVPREMSICAHSIMSDDPLIVTDLSTDPRFSTHPFVAGTPRLRFYVGVPIVLSSGFRVGSLCIVDLIPREAVPPDQVELLVSLAEVAARVLERVPGELPRASGTANDGKSEFLALIGHELRTPLTVLAGYVALLERRVDKGCGQRMAAAARRSCDHLRELIETIMLYSDADTGDLRLNDCCHPLARVLGEAVAVHAPAVEGSGKTIRLDADMAPVLQMDAAQIKLALTALIDNALLHGGAEITVASEISAEGHIEIAVNDDGVIASDRMLDELHKPFVVGGALDTRAVGGLGLGLPLVRKIIELHGGQFFLKSSARGTRAVIRLPAWRALLDGGALRAG